MSKYIDPETQGYKSSARDTRHPDVIAHSVLESTKIMTTQEIIPLTEEERVLREETLKKSTTQYAPFYLDSDGKWAAWPTLTVTTKEGEIVEVFNTEQALRDYFHNENEQQQIIISKNLKRAAPV
jgi:hypothetical protein